jgi:hypothetical protein
VGSYNDYKKEDQFFKLYALDQDGKKVSISFELHMMCCFLYVKNYQLIIQKFNIKEVSILKMHQFYFPSTKQYGY